MATQHQHSPSRVPHGYPASPLSLQSTPWLPSIITLCLCLSMSAFQELTLYKVTEMSTFSGTIHTTVPRYGFWMPGCQLWACKRQWSPPLSLTLP